MPTELPRRRIAPPESSAGGTLACVAAVLLMLILSYATLKQHPDGVAVASDAAQIQGL